MARGRHGNTALHSGGRAGGPGAASNTSHHPKEGSPSWTVAGDERRRKLSCNFEFRVGVAHPAGIADNAASGNAVRIHRQSVFDGGDATIPEILRSSITFGVNQEARRAAELLEKGCRELALPRHGASEEGPPGEAPGPTLSAHVMQCRAAAFPVGTRRGSLWLEHS